MVAAESGEVPVSHDRDFKAMVKRLGLSGARFRSLACSSSAALNRAPLLRCMSLIEHEWRYSQAQRNGVLKLEILKSVIRIER